MKLLLPLYKTCVSLVQHMVQYIVRLMTRFMTLLVVLLMPLYTVNANASDLTRQFPNKNITEIPLGSSVTYSMRINSQHPLSLGLATVFVSPGNGKLSFHSALELAEKLAQKGWYVDVVPASWLALPYEPKVAMSSTNATSDQTDPDKSAMKDSQDSGSMTASDKMIDTKSMVQTPKVIEPWMSELKPNLHFNELTEQMSDLLVGLQAQSTDIRGFRLVIAEGLSAALILTTANNETLNQPDAVTLISPFWPSNQVNESLAQFAANYPTPVLDITFASSNRFTSKTMLARKVNAKNNFKVDYRQRVIPRLQQRAAIEWVGGEIVGWTRSLGW